MTPTEIVGLAGVISTTGVAFAGYAFNAARSKGDREAARRLAADSHGHQLALRRSDRAYEDRKATYRLLLEWALVLIQQVEMLEPIAVSEGQPAPPKSPTEEDFRRMHVEVTAFASIEVQESFDEFRKSAQSFLRHVGVRQQLFAQLGPSDQVGEESAIIEVRRNETFLAHRRLEELIRRELANV
jgi:hypothetical protein